MALRVSRLLRELAPRWPIVLVCPEGGQSGADNGVALAAEINVTRAGQWMYLPSQYDVRPLVKAVTTAVAVHKPALALFWGGMEYLHSLVPGMPVSVSDRVDCMTLSTWRALRHARRYSDARERLANFYYALRYELQMRHESAATVVVGDADARVLRHIIRVPNVRVIPNGVDVPNVGPRQRTSRPTVMFTGVMSYRPNVEAVLYFADEVFLTVRERVPDAVFQIVGRSPAPEIVALAARPGIEIHADVESVQERLAEAWVAVAPMRTGAGIKNKILEAWSVSTPVAMTPMARNGLAQAPEELLLTAEGAELGSMIAALLLDSTRRTSLGHLARQTALNAFSWSGKGRAFDELLQEVSPTSSAANHPLRSNDRPAEA